MKLKVKLPFVQYCWLQRCAEANGLSVNQQLLAVLDYCRLHNRSAVHPNRRVIEVRTTPELDEWIAKQKTLSDLPTSAIVEEMVRKVQRDSSWSNPWRRFQ